MTRFIAYYRVSTDRQGRSGLGLEAQAERARQIVQSRGGMLLHSYTEIETGKSVDRPELAQALAHAKAAQATLLVAKLDRLARNARFLLKLADSGVNLLFGDLPEIPDGAAGRFVLTNMAAAAELEAGLISERVTAALAALKARGVVLGAPIQRIREKYGADCYRPWARKAAAESAKVRSRQSQEWQSCILGAIGSMEDGLTHREIAERLTARGYRSPRGMDITQPMVSRALKQA